VIGTVIVPAPAATIVGGIMPGTIIRAVLRPSRLIGESNAVETDGRRGERQQNGERGESERGLLHERHWMSSMLQIWKRSGEKQPLREDNAALERSILCQLSAREFVMSAMNRR
jgi:hypothetical protein